MQINPVALLLLIASVACSAAYNFIPHDGGEAYLPLLSIYSIHFATLLFVSRLVPAQKISVTAICIAAVACRIALLPSIPILENDFWRYMWDGHVLVNGVNPYQYAPADAALNHLDTPYRDAIGYSHFATIYPPLAEILFAIPAALAPGSVGALKLLLIAFDLATGYVLLQWLRLRGLDERWVALWLLNPLVLREIANAAHLDSIPVFFTTLALYLFERGWHLRAWLGLALGISTKIFPLVLVPFLFKLDPRRWRHAFAAIALVLLLYVPFLGAGSMLFHGSGAYAKFWIFNAGLYRGIDWVLDKILLALPSGPAVTWLYRLDTLTKIFIVALTGVVVLLLWRRLHGKRQLSHAALWSIGTVLLLSPVVDPWYVLWILPFAIMEFNLAWLAFGYLVNASYSWYLGKEAAFWFRSVEYVAFYLLLLWPLYRRWLGETVAGKRIKDFITR